jgi:methylase of polypeptide subunit release factors
MTKLLKEALAKLSKLSPERQDELAALLLAEMEDEARWDKSFAESQGALEKLADEALEEDKRGETRPFDETLLGEKG